MDRRIFMAAGVAGATIGAGALLGWPHNSSALASDINALKVEEMTAGLDTPWSFGFLPDGSQLITERDGRVLRLSHGSLTELAGVGPVEDAGQGGLLDVLVPRDFEQTRALYFTFAKAQGSGSGTALARATLSEDNTSLDSWMVVFEIAVGSSGGRHFGSRVVEGPDGLLYMTVGDRGDRPSAQDLERENGSVLRLAKDGSIPQDNPFTQTNGARPAIWSWGHRNPQGAAFDLEGTLWVAEHGARGGDELNLVRKGANFGWPEISYGRHYSGQKIGIGTEAEGMEQPAYFWDPSMAPSGLMIYSGELWPEWRGSFFVGSLKFDHIARLSGSPVQEVEQLKGPQTSRVRDIREAPDGSIWVLSVGNGALYRLSPA